MYFSDEPVNRREIPWWDIRNKPRKRHKESKSWSSYWMDDDSYEYFYKNRKKSGRKIAASIEGVSDGEVVDIEKAHRLSQLRRAVGNFVTIMTNRDDLKVVFSAGDQSYTDNKLVVISADDNPDNFDRVVGTALHESAHCVFTTNLWKYTKHARNSTSSKRRLMTKHGVDLKTINDIQELGMELGDYDGYVDNQWEIFWKILNFVEDRRIDNEVYKRAPGYRPYYEAMYSHYWNDAKIALRLLKDEELNNPSLHSYMVRIINMTNPATKYTLDRLPGFRKIVELVDLDNILRLSTKNGQARSKDIMDLVGAVYSIIAENVVEALKLTSDMQSDLELPGLNGQGSGEQDSDDNDTDNDSDGSREMSGTSGNQNPNDHNDTDLPNMDMGGNVTGQGNHDENKDGDQGKEDDQGDLSLDEIEKKVAEELGMKDLGKEEDPELLDEAMDRFLENDIPKDDLDKKTSDVISAMEDSNTTIDAVDYEGSTYDYVRVPKVTESVYNNLLPGSMKMAYKDKEPEYISQGRRLGQIIVNKIQIRHDKNDTKFTRRKRGKIDPRLIHSLGMGNQNVFFNKVEETYKDTVIYMTIDASGSVSGHWNRIMTMVVGFGYAAKKINNFDVVINLRYGTDAIWSITMFDSRYDTERELYKKAAMFKVAGTTPESLVYEIEYDYIRSLKDVDTNTYFVTLTDGAPNYYPSHAGYNGGFYERGTISGGKSIGPVAHCRQMMHKFKEIGVARLAYFVTNSTASEIRTSGYLDQFRKSYGSSAAVVPMTNFNKIAETLNKLLTENRE